MHHRVAEGKHRRRAHAPDDGATQLASRNQTYFCIDAELSVIDVGVCRWVCRCRHDRRAAYRGRNEFAPASREGRDVQHQRGHPAPERPRRKVSSRASWHIRIGVGRALLDTRSMACLRGNDSTVVGMALKRLYCYIGFIVDLFQRYNEEPCKSQ